MYLPKADLFRILGSLPYTVMQSNSNVFNKLPVITFEILDNSISLFLDNTIGYQDIVVKVDLWAEDSVTASKILSEVEAVMRQHYYRMTFSADVPNPDDSIYHISTRFETKTG